MDRNLAIVGCGVMGESLLTGLLATGWQPSEIRIAERSPSHQAALGKQYGVEVSADATHAVRGANTVILAVKPQDAATALREIEWFDPRPELLLSICAGIPIAMLEELAPGIGVVRAMPNIAVQSSVGATALCGGTTASEGVVTTAQTLLDAVGATVRVPERLFDAVTALSGNGPAYLFLLAEAMIDAGVNLGLPREIADALTRQTLSGAGQMLHDTDDSPTVLRHGVTSPAGTTAAAMRVFEANGFRSTILEAFYAAAARSSELGR